MAEFKHVWYRNNEKKLASLKAMQDSGTLTVNGQKLSFIGKQSQVTIADIHNISYGAQGADFVNDWVKVDYGDNQTAYFKDGSWLGWGGLFGGTRKLLNVIQSGG